MIVVVFEEKEIIKKKGKNTILVPIFWGYNQFSPYISVIVNLIPVIFNSQSI